MSRHCIRLGIGGKVLDIMGMDPCLRELTVHPEWRVRLLYPWPEPHRDAMYSYKII